MNVFHLARRALTSFRNHPVSTDERAEVESILLPGEYSLWQRMQPRDQRHSIEVLHRFDVLVVTATRDDRAAALLHDVGKCVSSLGWLGRICATVIGPRTPSFRTYLNHEAIGLELAKQVSSTRTCEVLHGEIVDQCVDALRRADDI